MNSNIKRRQINESLVVDYESLCTKLNVVYRNGISKENLPVGKFPTSEYKKILILLERIRLLSEDSVGSQNIMEKALDTWDIASDVLDTMILEIGDAKDDSYVPLRTLDHDISDLLADGTIIDFILATSSTTLPFFFNLSEEKKRYFTETWKTLEERLDKEIGKTFSQDEDDSKVSRSKERNGKNEKKGKRGKEKVEEEEKEEDPTAFIEFAEREGYIYRPSALKSKFEEIRLLTNTNMPTGLFIIYGRANTGKSRALRHMAVLSESAGYDTWYLEFQEPSALAITARSNLDAVLTNFLQHPKTNILFIDSLSHLLYSGGNLGAGGVSYGALEKLAAISANFMSKDKVCFAVLNPLQEKVYSDTMEALIGSTTGLIEIKGPVEPTSDSSMNIVENSLNLVGGSFRHIKPNDDYYSRIPASEITNFFPWLNPRDITHSKKGAASAHNTIEIDDESLQEQISRKAKFKDSIADLLDLSLDREYSQF